MGSKNIHTYELEPGGKFFGRLFGGSRGGKGGGRSAGVLTGVDLSQLALYSIKVTYAHLKPI